MKKTLYAVIGWLTVWYGRRYLSRKLRIVGR
jgi:hypothetical protein